LKRKGADGFGREKRCDQGGGETGGIKGWTKEKRSKIFELTTTQATKDEGGAKTLGLAPDGSTQEVSVVDWEKKSESVTE